MEHLWNFLVFSIVLIIYSIRKEKIKLSNMVKGSRTVKVNVVRNGDFTEIEASQLVPGDVIEIQNEFLVPADCVLIRRGFKFLFFNCVGLAWVHD